LGGDGLSGTNNFDGREIVSLRGYTNESLTPGFFENSNIGGTVFTKYTLRVKVPINR